MSMVFYMPSVKACKETQEKLFELGAQWRAGKGVKNTSAKCLILLPNLRLLFSNRARTPLDTGYSVGSRKQLMSLNSKEELYGLLRSVQESNRS